MRNNLNHIYKIILGLFIVTAFWGCGEMLDDPTIDKDTGEDINLLIVDFNFFTTRMDFRLIDANDNSLITKSAKIWFTGENANDIVNFAGEKNQEYITPQGQIELSIDPNITPSGSTPFTYAVNVEIEGYQPFSQGIEVLSEGKKTYELMLVKASNENDTMTGTEEDDSFVFSYLFEKSAMVDEKPYEVKFSISKTDLIQFTDYYNRPLFDSIAELDTAYANSNKEYFIQLTINNKKTDYNAIIDRVNVDGVKKSIVFQKLETGDFGSLSVDGRLVADFKEGGISAKCVYTNSPEPDLFGFTTFNTDSWSFTGLSNYYTSPDFSYVVAKASLDPLCSTGATIKFSSNAQSSFSIDADIYDANGQMIKSTNFKGKFPESFTLENVPSGAATLVFRNNNPAFAAISNLSVNDMCSGTYDVDVETAEGYEEYQIVLKAICPDNPTIAVAPTYSGQIRIKDSDDDWQGIDMEGGIVDVLAKPGEIYELRLLWEDNWESSDFSTEFDANGNYINKTGSKIETEELGDGRTRFVIEHEFEQNICDDMGW
ncbi:hypothetical protein [uncultured Draconibacterium sp.]|uniref:hypothetical protein n=1 Tax=uncultured Draconibacterium sp. TaxID=1573823 RepID=UPI002AA6FE7D|nr:hypothetical protein [uncultured Draconibacterium sp.]